MKIFVHLDEVSELDRTVVKIREFVSVDLNHLLIHLFGRHTSKYFRTKSSAHCSYLS